MTRTIRRRIAKLEQEAQPESPMAYHVVENKAAAEQLENDIQANGGDLSRVMIVVTGVPVALGNSA
jgi:uncharacterized surface protein with fasciclin (FAS1) repeats